MTHYTIKDMYKEAKQEKGEVSLKYKNFNWNLRFNSLEDRYFYLNGKMIPSERVPIDIRDILIRLERKVIP